MISDEKLLNLYRLNNITRYNNKTKLKEESVAAHSYYVALFSLMFADEMRLTDKEKLDLICRALLHDLCEIELNDITHDTKEKLKLDNYLEKFEKEYYEKHFPKYAKLMFEHNKISKIMKLADALSVKQFVLNEYALGNKSEQMTEIMYEITNRIKMLEGEINE